MLKKTKTSFSAIDHTTWQWKVFLIYDMIMMVLIVLNLLTLGINALILSDFGEGVAQNLNLQTAYQDYLDYIVPLVKTIDRYFILFMLFELLTRWCIAIVGKHHQRWFFFPFIHWYEVLSLIPQLRFLRLLRAGVIAYRLHELGYQVIPKTWIKRGRFYYDLVLEELTSRIVLTVIDGVEKELDTSSTHHQLIHDLIDHHRQQFAIVLAQTLQECLATALQQQRHIIASNIGEIVHQSIEDTPELKNILRKMPVVGSLLEQRIQAIGRRLAENITQGIIDPLSDDQTSEPLLANALLSDVADRISNIPLNSAQIDQLVESIVRESLEAIRKQVKIKQWEQLLEQSNNHMKNMQETDIIK